MTSFSLCGFVIFLFFLGDLVKKYMKYIVYLYERIEKSEHEWDLSMFQAELVSVQYVHQG